MSGKKTFSYKLFVEGINDLHIVASLCAHHKVTENFNIEDCRGIENVIGKFRIALTNPAVYQRIGVVIDADSDMKSRWKQLIDILEKSGKYNCEKLELSAGGLILHPLKMWDAVVGIWIMPDNTLVGMLEDFALSLVSPEDALMRKAESVLSELEAQGIQQYKEAHRSKAKVHTFLAWHDEPGKPIGQAITAHILNPDAVQAKVFIDWINKLYK